MDWVIRNGLIADGKGSSLIKGDVGILAGRIACVCPRYEGSTRREIDASELVVSPGFIDIHSHSDESYFVPGFARSKLYQGVTTELVGNCGTSFVPLSGRNRQAVLGSATQKIGGDTADLPESACHTGDYLNRLSDTPGGLTANIATLVGHGTLRRVVVGDLTEISPDDIAAMQALLARQFEEGAIGLSLGLAYAPGCFARREELTALFATAKAYGRMVTVHMRNEGEDIMSSLDEVLSLSEESGVQLQISHLKIMSASLWGKAGTLLAKTEAARRRGARVFHDCYPYTASSTGLNVLLPRWALEGGNTAMLERLHDDGTFQKCLPDLRHRLVDRGGPAHVALCGVSADQAQGVAGFTVADLSEHWAVSPEEVIRRVLLRYNGHAKAIFHAMSDTDMEEILRDEYTVIGSDGSSLPFSSMGDHLGNQHPRNYGTFARFLELCRRRNLMPIEQAIRKMTGLTAEIIGLKDRGRLEKGCVADIVLFDPDTVCDSGTYSDPAQKPEGIRHVMLGGEWALFDGEAADTFRGVALRS